MRSSLGRVMLGPLLVIALVAASGSVGSAASPVADAAQRGDVSAVRSLLRQGADVNAAQGDGMTALHWSALRGDIEISEVLIYAGANLEATTRVGGHTPLLVAARTGHPALVIALADAGADVSAHSSTGVTALHFIAGAGDRGALETLIAHGAVVDALEWASGQTPLFFAADRGRTDAVQALIEAGANVNASSMIQEVARLEEEDRGDARLRRERVEAMAQLVESRRVLEEGAYEEEAPEEELTQESPEDAPTEPGAPGEVPDTVQVAADSDGEAEADGAAVVDEAGVVDEDAKAEAAEEEAEEEEEEERDAVNRNTEVPLSYGELVGGVGGLTPLHHALRGGHRETALALLDGGADVNLTTGGDGTSPILIATINGHFDLALELMARGADINLTSDAGVAPLYAAINVQWAPKALYPQPKAHQRQEVGYLQFIETLLQNGADPDVRLTRHIWYMSYNFDLLGVNTRGSTPFWRAAYATDVPAMRLLVAAGADHSVPTAKAPSRRRSSDSDEDLSGLPPIEVGGPGIFPIHAASGVGYGKGYAGNSHEHAPDGWLPSVRYLIEELGHDVDGRDHEGYSALHHAASRGDNELILYLVERGADVTLLSRKGQTTADMANGPVSRVQPFLETVALLEGLGSKNNDKCLSCE